MGIVFVICGVAVLYYAKEPGTTEFLICGRAILISLPWFLIGRLGMRTINIEEKVFNEFGEEGVKELRENHQAFNWRNIKKKNTQQVAGGDATR